MIDGNPESREDTSTASKQPIRMTTSLLGTAVHVCAFFNTHDDEYRVMLPFVKEGFERGEKGFYIVDPERRDEHLQRLAKKTRVVLSWFLEMIFSKDIEQMLNRCDRDGVARVKLC